MTIPKWILHDAAFRYWIGDFDGTRFVPETGPLRGDLGANFYAAQTWTNLGRRVVQIAWMRGGEYPGMLFNQQMSFPCELSLCTTPRGLRLCRMPVGEIVSLRVDTKSVKYTVMAPGTSLDIGDPGDLWDIELSVTPDSSFVIRLGGQDIIYAEGQIQCLGQQIDLPPSDEIVSLRILADRTSIEIFGNHGEISMSSCFLPRDTIECVQLSAGPGGLDLRRLVLHRLTSSGLDRPAKPEPGEVEP